VLELGSGCGFTGLITALACGSKHVILTDGHNRVLEQLVENVHLNCEVIANKGPELAVAKVNETVISVTKLEWENVTSVSLQEDPEIILAAGNLH